MNKYFDARTLERVNPPHQSLLTVHYCDALQTAKSGCDVETTLMPAEDPFNFRVEAGPRFRGYNYQLLPTRLCTSFR